MSDESKDYEDMKSVGSSEACLIKDSWQSDLKTLYSHAMEMVYYISMDSKGLITLYNYTYNDYY